MRIREPRIGARAQGRRNGEMMNNGVLGAERTSSRAHSVDLLGRRPTGPPHVLRLCMLRHPSDLRNATWRIGVATRPMPVSDTPTCRPIARYL